MLTEQSLYSSAIAEYRSDYNYIGVEEGLTQADKERLFALQCNGFFAIRNSGRFIFDPEVTRPFAEEFAGQRVSFFGPESRDIFFAGEKVPTELLVPVLQRQEVTTAIGKYRKLDEDQAARLAYILGGLVRHLAYINPNVPAEEVANKAAFVARMTKMGDERSAEAIASAMAMYVISGGPPVPNNDFTGDVYRMAEAVSDDPIIPYQTEDLGVSQVARLSSFWNRTLSQQQDFPDIVEYWKAWENFPTVGAEFHFPLDAPDNFPYFWQRLAILNMSQYQRGCYIQLSRNDRDVIEVRMNPSYYPITVANWQFMRLLLPELNKAFFTVTLNRRESQDFYWGGFNKYHPLLEKLRALGMLVYAGKYETIPRQDKEEEVNFGTIYLGQTVRMQDGVYKFTGDFGGWESSASGQMGVYTGWGKNLPDLTYYLSMALERPNILGSLNGDDLSKVTTLQDALGVAVSERRAFFRAINRRIASDDRLNTASKSGEKIINLLSP